MNLPVREVGQHVGVIQSASDGFIPMLDDLHVLSASTVGGVG